MSSSEELKLENDSSIFMDLSKLLTLGVNFPLLRILSIGDDLATLKSLRQVSKAINEHALLALMTYTLILEGDDGDTNVSGASLLQQAKLSKLTLHLKLTGFYSPAILLRAFVHEVDPALATVTCLELHQEDIGGSKATARVLDGALKILLKACPCMGTLYCSKGGLSPSLMQAAGLHCPLLTTLYLNMCAVDALSLQNLMYLQPSLLPNLSHVILRGHGYKLPDLSHNNSIVTLVLQDYGFSDATAWLCLPPRLRHLECEQLLTGPSLDLEASTAMLPSLLSLTFKSSSFLESLAAVVRAAPAMQVLKREGGCHPHVLIVCVLSPTTAADLSLLYARMDLEVVTTLEFCFEYIEDDDQEFMKQFIVTLPKMIGITRFGLSHSMAANVSLLLEHFPNTQYLFLWSESLSDTDLYDVASSVQLVKLHLCHCNNITAMGIALMCQHLPTLQSIRFQSCDKLQLIDQQKCQELLKMYGRDVQFKTG